MYAAALSKVKPQAQTELSIVAYIGSCLQYNYFTENCQAGFFGSLLRSIACNHGKERIYKNSPACYSKDIDLARQRDNRITG